MADTRNETLGSGEVHFSLLKPGTFTPAGFDYFGNTLDFNVTSKTTDLDHMDTDHGIKELDNSVTLDVSREGTFKTDNISMTNVGRFFLGSASTVAQAAVATQTETFTGTIPGLSYQVGFSVANPAGLRALTTVVVKVAAAVKVLGTDYLLDADRGIVTVVKGGTIVAGDAVIVEYDLLARKIDRVVSGRTVLEGAVQFRSFNSVGEKKDFLMRFVRLSPNGDFALKGDTWQELSFTMKILKAPGFEGIYANGQPYV